MTIKIFVGTSANGEDGEAELTLEYTLKKHSSQPIEVTWMRQSKDPHSPFNGWKTKTWATPFSGFRWAIPELCNFQGRAIYMDVDMICLADIAELINVDMAGKPALGKPYNGVIETSVMLMDCEALKKHMPSIDNMKQTDKVQVSMSWKVKPLMGKLDNRWNVFDGEYYDVSNMWILHYTKMSSQPWQPKWFRGQVEGHSRPELAKLWYRLRDEALSNGYTVPDGYEHFGPYDIVGKVA